LAHVSDTFTVIGHEGIPVDEAADAVRQDVGDGGNDHAAGRAP
jgi:hypothetical protein